MSDPVSSTSKQNVEIKPPTGDIEEKGFRRKPASSRMKEDRAAFNKQMKKLRDGYVSVHVSPCARFV